MKKIIKFLTFRILNFLYDKIFGKLRDVKHIWKPGNYINFNKYYWSIIERPLQNRGIYLPLDFKNIKSPAEFKTFHNEHLVLDEFSKLVDNRSGDSEKYFIDIGAGDGVDMSNTFNLVLNNYKGYMIESDDSKFAKLGVIYRDFPDIQLLKTIITPDNIVQLLSALNLPPKLDVLNLDIDSYDYEVLDKILPKFNFKFLILEFNPLFPKSIDFYIKYEKGVKYESPEFYGASLSIFYKLLKKYNYSAVHVDRSFLFAIDSNYLNSKIQEKEINELEKTLKSSLINNDPEKWETLYKFYWSYSDEEIIDKSKELFKEYSNYIIKKSEI